MPCPCRARAVRMPCPCRVHAEHLPAGGLSAAAAAAASLARAGGLLAGRHPAAEQRNLCTPPRLPPAVSRLVGRAGVFERRRLAAAPGLATAACPEGHCWPSRGACYAGPWVALHTRGALRGGPASAQHARLAAARPAQKSLAPPLFNGLPRPPPSPLATKTGPHREVPSPPSPVLPVLAPPPPSPKPRAQEPRAQEPRPQELGA